MKQLRNEQGYALAIAVLVITVLSILGISLMATTGNSKKMANKEQENQAAYYIAEAGMNLKKAEIKKAADQFRKDTAGWNDTKLENALKQPPKINTSTTYNSKNSNGTDKVFDTNNASAKVTVEYTTKPGGKTTTDNQTKAVQNYIYKIKSVGMIDNQKRTITSTMSYDLTVNSEEQKPDEKPDEEIDGYYPIEGIPEASIHSLNKLTFSGGKLSGKLALGLDSTKYQDNIPFSSNANWGEYYDVVLKTSYSPRTCNTNNLECINTKRYSESIMYNQPDKVKLYPFPSKFFDEINSSISERKFNLNSKKIMSTVTSNGEYLLDKTFNSNEINIGNNNVTIHVANNFEKPLKIRGGGNLTLISNEINLADGSFTLDIKVNELDIYAKKFLTSSSKLNSFSAYSIKFFVPTIDIQSPSTFISNDILFKANNISFSTREALTLQSEKIRFIANNEFNFNNFGLSLTNNNMQIISNSIIINPYADFPVQENLSIFAKEKLTVNSTFNKTKAKIFFDGSSPPSFGGGVTLNADLDFSSAFFQNFNLTKFTGNVILRNSKTNTVEILLDGPMKTFYKHFFYAPNFNLKLDSGKHFTGVMVGKNINIPNGFVSYAEPDISTIEPPTNENGGNNGSNNGDSIIIDSSFSDAIDSGTVEIDNDR